MPESWIVTGYVAAARDFDGDTAASTLAGAEDGTDDRQHRGQNDAATLRRPLTAPITRLPASPRRVRLRPRGCGLGEVLETGDVVGADERRARLHRDDVLALLELDDAVRLRKEGGVTDSADARCR